MDPSKAPDPEEPEDFDKDSFQTLVNTGFEMPEESDTVTLDPCECRYGHMTIMCGERVGGSCHMTYKKKKQPAARIFIEAHE